MKKIKKVVTLVLTMCLVASLFAGCKSQSTNGKKKFEVWTPNSHSKPVVTEIINKWNETEGERLGVEIVYSVKEGNIQQTVEMAFASDQEPDIFSSVVIEKYASSGEIVPIKSLPGGEEYLEKYINGPIDMTRPDFSDSKGDIYCLPLTVNTFGLVYNKDMFKKYGIVDENGEPTPPKTFEELRKYAKIMTNEKEKDYGIVLPMKWNSFVSVDINQLSMGSSGFSIYNPIKGEYDFSVLKPIYEMYMGIKEDGSYFPAPETLDNDTARAYFAERNIGMKFAGSYDVGVFNTQFPAKCDWGVAPYPVANENDRYLQHMGVGGSCALTKAAVEKVGAETAFEIYKFFHSDEYVRALYQKGMALPYDFEVVKDVKVDDGLKGWEEFSKLATISTGGYASGKTDLTGEKNATAVFVEEIWAGTKSVDDAINELNQRYNGAMKKFYDNNPTVSKDAVTKTEWNIKIDSNEVEY